MVYFTAKINRRRENFIIIAMTANAFEEDRMEATTAGMNDHLAKPINIDRLKEVLKFYL